MLIARAGVNWNGGKATGSIDAYRTGWWVSGIVELGLHADRVLYRPCPSNLFHLVRMRLTQPYFSDP